MKRFLLGMLLLAGLSACNHKSAAVAHGSGDDAQDSLAVGLDSIAVSMSLKVVGIPDSLPLVTRLAQFIGEQVFYSEDDDSRPVQPAYDGDLQTFLQACVQKKWEELKLQTFPDGDIGRADGDSPSAEELAAGMVDEDGEQMFLSTYAITFTRVYETDDYVTWQSNCEFYVNNTSGPNFGAAGITLRKSDGQPLGYGLLKDTDSAAFALLLKEAVRQWVTDVLELEADTDEQLQSYIFGERQLNHLPLPGRVPYLTADGVVLPYQASELIFTSEPQLIVLPYDRVKPYLNNNL